MLTQKIGKVYEKINRDVCKNIDIFCDENWEKF